MLFLEGNEMCFAESVIELNPEPTFLLGLDNISASVNRLARLAKNPEQEK